MKILLAVDGSDYTRRMLAWLATHDEVFARGAIYTFLTVVPEVPPHVTRFVRHQDVEDAYRDAAAQVMDPIALFADRHGWTFTTRTQVGRAGDAIAKAAADGGFDLVVMGSHGHSALGTLVLGSVTQQVLGACRVPVLVVR